MINASSASIIIISGCVCKEKLRSIYCLSYVLVSNSVVSIVTCYGLDSLGIESQWGWGFLHPSWPSLGPTKLPVQWVPVFFFTGGVKQLGRGIDHQPPSSAEVNERVDLYLYSPSGPSWPVLGWTFPLPYVCIYVHMKYFSFDRTDLTNTSYMRPMLKQLVPRSDSCIIFLRHFEFCAYISSCL